ncbi:MAG: amidoligase family protein [Deltaproteobacteria bacterium]|nr:amidoligase family protein [Deltaproteobacteria bacterium]MBW1957704.1 amidoligase family protein [Deltaproteobacteria bacterium]MBW2012905.1 amidoligase family protein [Deltaproteobacteria bacterium]MBW2088580.1 amidoligase family protein [Deltaproteobacteria bacterium]MBW2319402.1 amidoligase family protein [Deltaproteobacteria bacterium]
MSLSQKFTLRLMNQFPMLQYFTYRPFGIEIEFYGLDYVLAPIDNNIIKPYCISSRAKDGRNIQDLYKDFKVPIGADRDCWHFEKDGSVRGKGHTQFGAELTSPILSGIPGLVQAYNAFRFLCNIQGIDIDNSCGFHVHHGVDPKVFTWKQLQELVRLVYPIEDYFYLLIPGKREHAETCKPMEIDVKAFLDVCDSESEKGSDKIKQLWYSSKNHYDPKSASYPRYDKTRYHGLNLHSYWYRSTIEFRYHSAVLHNIDEAMEWIIFTQFLIELSQGNVPDICFYPEANKWLNAIYMIYENFGYGNCIKRLAN